MSNENNVTASGQGAISIGGSAKQAKITTHVETSSPVSLEAAPSALGSDGAGGIKSPAEALAALEAAARSHPEFFKARKTVVASGTGAIAIGGDVEGGTIEAHVREIGSRPTTQPPEERPPEFPALDREVDLILRIRAKSGDDYWFDAKAAGRQTTPVVRALPRAREFASKLAELSRANGRPDLALSLLRALGQTIAGALPSDWLKPQGPLAAAFADSRKTSSILILSDEAFIPWELAWINGPNPGFLGERAKVGRWPVDAPPPPSQARLGAFHVFAATSYADAGVIDLPNAVEERKQLVEAHQGIPHEAVEKELVDWLYAPQQGAASFHLAAHGYNVPMSNEQALILGDGTRLKPEHLLAIREDGVARTYALVFLNACQTGSGGDSLGQVAGFPGVLARSGSGAVIAPLWEVGDAAARDFAVNFYDRILSQESEVAMALKLMRGQLKDACGLHRYAYSFFGHPLLKISY